MPRFNLTIVVAVAVALPLSVSSGIEPTKDSLETVQKNVEQGKAVLVGVREKSEWEKGHIKDCVFLPLSELREGMSKKELKEKLPERKILYTYCVVGKRAVTAGGTLEKADYEVRPLKAGYQDLLKAGFEGAKE